MNKNPQNQFLFNEIRQILIKDWDPIGIRDIPEAQDEYDSYVSTIYSLLQTKKSENELFNYLWWVETEHMELPGNKTHTLSVAQKLSKL